MKNIRLLMMILFLAFSAGASASAADQPLAQTDGKCLAQEVLGSALRADAMPVDVSAPAYSLEGRRMSHVPEPEGWAMMLMGVGFVVYQVRRRKRARESWDLR